MARMAIISDVHANIEALMAVIADIESQDIDRIMCLGDVVGYGPNPIECVKLVMEKCEVLIMGNHEQALTEGGTRFRAIAKHAIEWTLAELKETPEGLSYLDKINALPRKVEAPGFLYVHGSPRGPTEEYILPRLSKRPDILQAQFDILERYCFVGHTHLPGIFEPDAPFCPPAEMIPNNTYILDGESKGIINVGSVGQPRDSNPHACYVTFGGDMVKYHRVEYNAELTCKKIKSIAMLDDHLGERLLIGK